MIAFPKPGPAGHRSSSWQEGFLRMLPKIEEHAQIAFRDLRGEAREEAVQEAVANAAVAYARLFELGKTDIAYPGVLGRFAVAQVRSGRKVGTRQNSKDVMSRIAQGRHSFAVERLDRYDRQDGEWIEAVVEDQRTPVADQAAFRCDFPRWLGMQPRRERRIAELLAVGYGTSELAKRFRLSPGRISQLRRKLHGSWQQFHGEEFQVHEVIVPAS